MELVEVNLPVTMQKDQSIVFITMHKAASVFVNDVLHDILGSNGYPHIDFAGEAFNSGVKEWDYCVNRSHLFSQQGYYFGAFRGPYVDKFEDLSNNKIVIQVRDPRDCIVSLYYSYMFSHAEPGKGALNKLFHKIKKSTSEMDIDEFAIQQARSYSHRLDNIEYIMENYQDYVLISYEDMVTNFNKWYIELVSYLDVDVSEKIKDKIFQEGKSKPEEEDVNQHRRQVTPGDYKRKLLPATQIEITKILEWHLLKFNYNLDI